MSKTRTGNARWWDEISGLPAGMSNGRYLCNERHESRGIVKSLVRAHMIEKNKVICDLGCGTGIYHYAFLNSSLFGVDFSKSSMDIAKMKNKHVTYVHCNLKDNDQLFQTLIDIAPTKIIINNYIHYLDDEETKGLIETCLKCETVKQVFIGDIPLGDKKKRIRCNPLSLSYMMRALKFFFIRNVTKLCISQKELATEMHVPTLGITIETT